MGILLSLLAFFTSAWGLVPVVMTKGNQTVDGDKTFTGNTSVTTIGSSSTIKGAGGLGVTYGVTAGTVTVNGNSFSVGGSSFSVVGGSATVAYQMSATVFSGSGASLTNIPTSAITDLAVTTPKIATDAIITAKIITNAVTTDKLATDSVITAKILDGAVTTSKLGTASVTNTKTVGTTATCGAAQFLSNATWVNGLPTGGSCASSGSGDAVLAATQTFSGANTFLSTTTLRYTALTSSTVVNGGFYSSISPTTRGFTQTTTSNQTIEFGSPICYATGTYTSNGGTLLLTYIAHTIGGASDVLHLGFLIDGQYAEPWASATIKDVIINPGATRLPAGFATIIPGIAAGSHSLCIYTFREPGSTGTVQCGTATPCVFKGAEF